MAPQPRVLMVEDHPDVADLYQLKLQLEGYRVAVASDGAAGLQLARSLKPDLIVLDIHVPQLDGLQLLAALREDETTRISWSSSAPKTTTRNWSSRRSDSEPPRTWSRRICCPAA